MLREAITPDAIELAGRISSALQPQVFADDRCPSIEQWRTALAAQMRTVPDLESAFHTVRRGVSEAAAWEPAVWQRRGVSRGGGGGAGPR